MKMTFTITFADEIYRYYESYFNVMSYARSVMLETVKF